MCDRCLTSSQADELFRSVSKCQLPFYGRPLSPNVNQNERLCFEDFRPIRTAMWIGGILVYQGKPSDWLRDIGLAALSDSPNRTMSKKGSRPAARRELSRTIATSYSVSPG